MTPDEINRMFNYGEFLCDQSDAYWEKSCRWKFWPFNLYYGFKSLRIGSKGLALMQRAFQEELILKIKEHHE